jgi:hypothetical protein
LALVLQPLDWHHQHVAWPIHGCSSVPSTVAPACLRHCTIPQPSDTAGGGLVHTSPGTSPAASSSASTVVLTLWSTLWDPQSLASSFGTMELSYPNPSTDWVADSGASSHTTPYPGNIHSSRPPSSAHPPSIVGNGSVLPVTSVGDSVLPGPFYLNEILVAPNLVQNLLSVHRFTTNNSCSMEFDPFGLSVKDLTTRSVIARYDSPGPLYTIPLCASATSAPAT